MKVFKRMGQSVRAELSDAYFFRRLTSSDSR